MKRFAIIGAAGYVAPKHMEAIKATGNELVAAFDKFDSVGILDRYFPHADFFVEFERFDRHLEKLKREGKGIDYLIVCSPNYLHDSHCRFGLKLGADIICEKPVVLNARNVDALKIVEQQTNHKVNCILQLRLHPEIVELKKQIDADPSKDYEVDLKYITHRGNWYQISWKGDDSKSGGIETNIGIHLFDMLIYLFGNPTEVTPSVREHKSVRGKLRFKNASVNWFLSIDAKDLPSDNGSASFHRSIVINDELLDFTTGFDQLHTQSYKAILEGEGFGLDDARSSISLVNKIRSKKII